MKNQTSLGNLIAKNVFLFLLLINSVTISGQTQLAKQRPYIPILGRELTESEIFETPNIQKKPGHYTKEDWAKVIDETWGPGLPTSEKLRIFDTVWNHIDQDYGGFVNFDVDIDSLRDLWRPEIEGGVSRGRFAGIMTHFIQILNENHTTIFDIPLLWGTWLRPGIPIFVIGHWWTDNKHFGAVLTPLKDSSVVVLRAVPNHKLDLERGDIILGYDGIPWKKLYKELLDAQLPIRNQGVGSTKESMTHIILSSAGLNWHLFDTIDIVKYSTGDTLHLSTFPLRYQYLRGSIWGNEHMDVPGVPMPDYLNYDYVTWGIVQDTQVGYIYVGAWLWDGYEGRNYGINEKFYNAVDSLMHYHQTTGLIIDCRCNPGGGPQAKWGGYSLLFNERITKTGFVERGNPNNHYDMVWHSNHYYANPDNFSIPGDPTTYYDKPIAVLIGPGSNSAADWSSLKMRFHPMARIFGKPSNGAFSLFDEPDLGDPDWWFRFATSSGILLDDPSDYLIHRGAHVDEKVWFTQEDVANGEDTVVKAAIAWINGISNVNETNHCKIPSELYLWQNYPNPFNSATTIKYSIPKDTKVTLKIYNILGQEIKLLVDEFQTCGNKSVIWYATDNLNTAIPTGVYYYRIQAGSEIQSKKIIYLK